MKLFIVAALISAVSAARLEHLERGYLPPTQNNYGSSAGGNGFPTASAHGNFGLSNQGSQYSAPGRNSNGFGAFGQSNGLVGNAGSNGFGPNSGRGSNGFGGNGAESGKYGAQGASGRNSGSSAATSNQYLPPNFGASGSNSGSPFGSSIRSACSTCGSSTFGSPQRYQQQNSIGSHGLSIPSTQYGSPQSFIPSSSFESQQSYSAQEPAGASRQYLAPKASSAQNAPQQPFDENSGYIY